MKWKLEKIDDRFFIVSSDGERLEAGHSELVANHALATLNSGIAEIDPDRDLNPYKKGRWTENRP